ncbi:MAG: site-specific integrase [Rikenellaceae bacterium]
MATIKAKFRPSTVEGKEGVIFYQVIHGRSVRQIKTDYSVQPHEWNNKGSSAIIDESDPERAKHLKLINDKIGFDIRRLYQLAKTLENRGRMNHCDDLIYEYQRQPKGQTFFNYFRGQIKRLEELGRGGTSYNYSATFNSFFRFRGGEDLIFDNLTSELMEEYEAFLKSEKVSMNSSSFYMRILRAVYNKAVDKGITEQQHPFKRVYTGIEKTMKRALPLKEIKRIKELDLSATSAMEYARDLFMLSFYTRGMSFVDMAHLCKSDIKNGILSYRRRKTGQLLHIKWETCMQEIVNRYYIEDSIYLLPVMHNIAGKTKEHNLYKGELCKVNNNLKKIAESIKLAVPLTMYVARHSWASAARTKNIPISVISEGMGHDSEATTQIYLASLDTSVVDKANSVILKAL